MLKLSRKEIDALLKLVGRTGESEIDCDQCLSRIAEFAEHRLAGRSITAGLEAVERHLSICAECCEEYRALRRALEDMDG